MFEDLRRKDVSNKQWDEVTKETEKPMYEQENSYNYQNGNDSRNYNRQRSNDLHRQNNKRQPQNANYMNAKQPNDRHMFDDLGNTAENWNQTVPKHSKQREQVRKSQDVAYNRQQPMQEKRQKRYTKSMNSFPMEEQRYGDMLNSSPNQNRGLNGTPRMQQERTMNGNSNMNHTRNVAPNMNQGHRNQAMNPSQMMSAGPNVTPNQTMGAGPNVTPSQTMNAGPNVTPSQPMNFGSNVTSSQTMNVGMNRNAAHNAGMVPNANQRRNPSFDNNHGRERGINESLGQGRNNPMPSTVGHNANADRLRARNGNVEPNSGMNMEPNRNQNPQNSNHKVEKNTQANTDTAMYEKLDKALGEPSEMMEKQPVGKKGKGPDSKEKNVKKSNKGSSDSNNKILGGKGNKKEAIKSKKKDASKEAKPKNNEKELLDAKKEFQPVSKGGKESHSGSRLLNTKSMHDGDIIISMRNVVKDYSNGTRALNNISIQINKGEFVFIVGSSGSGKSTLMKLLQREEEATSGSIYVNGFHYYRINRRQIPKLRRTMGVVFQNFRLLKDRSVYENIAFAQRAVGKSTATIKRRVPEVLKLVSLSAKMDAYPNQLSGGEQQRVAIARAIANKPLMLLADEPTGNLDPKNTWEIMKLLDDINQLGTTVVVVTHNSEIVDAMQKRVITIEKGVLVSDEQKGGYGLD